MLGTKTEFEVTEMQAVLGNDVGGDFERFVFCLSAKFEGYAGASPSSIGNEVTMLGVGNQRKY